MSPVAHFRPVIGALLLTAVVALAVGATQVRAADTAGSGNAAQADPAVPTLVEIRADIDAGRLTTARTRLKAYVAANEADADGWNLYGYVHRKQQRYLDAEKYYRTALKLDPSHLGALVYQGELFLETGRPNLAQENLARLQALCGNCAEYGGLLEAIEAAAES